MKKTLIIFGALAVFGITIFIPSPAHASNCSFTRDLDLGNVGEDVRCLQKYLNATGFVISDSGVGSPGNETSLLRDLTKEAIKKWQKANGLPASGFFGPASRQKFSEITKSGSNTSPDTSLSALTEKLANLKAQLAAATATTTQTTIVKPVTVITSDTNVKQTIQQAIKMIRKAEDQIDDGVSGANITRAQGNLEDAKDDLFDAVAAYMSGNYTKALDDAKSALDNANDAFDDAGGESVDDEADTMIQQAENAIDDADQEIEDADDDDKDVKEARATLQKAEDKLDAANEAYDDEDYEEAKSLAKEAKNLANDATDAIGKSGKQNALSAINKAKSAINSTQDDIDDADDNDEDTDDAKAYIKKAKSKLNAAQDAYDDEDYEEAQSLANDAKDYADDASDAL